jgi:hypothetical protein
MRQLLTEMQEARDEDVGTVLQFLGDMSKTERRAMSELFDMCQEYCTLSNDLFDIADGEQDGQPSEAQEWHDFDPDC